MKIAYWAEQIEIQSEVVRGLAACADGKADECLAILRAAATVRTPPRSTPSRPARSCPRARCWPPCCLKEGKAADALREFETVLVKEPNRYRAFAGAMQAAELTRDTKKATIVRDADRRADGGGGQRAARDRTGAEGARQVGAGPPWRERGSS